MGQIYLLLTIVFLFLCVRKVLRGEIDNIFYTYFVTFLLGYFVPGILQCNASRLGYNSILDPTWKGLAMIVLFFIFYELGTRVKFRIGGRYTTNNEFDYYIPNEEIFVKKLANFIIVFSLAFFLIYCSFYGGVFTVMKNISNIRYGSLAISNAKVGFISKLYYCVTLAPVLLAGYWNKKGKISRTNIVIAFLAAGLITVSTGSRGSLGLLLLNFLIPPFCERFIKWTNSAQMLISTKKFRKVMKVGILALLVFFFVSVLYRPIIGFTQVWASSGFSNAIDNITEELGGSRNRYSVASGKDILYSLYLSFRHPIVSLEKAIQMVDSGMHKKNYFLEFYIMLQSVIPSKLLGVTKLDGIVDYNSRYLEGPYHGNVPPGIVGSAYYSGGILWVIFYGLLFGYLSKKLDNVNSKLIKHTTFGRYYQIFSIFLFQNVFMGGDFDDGFKNMFTKIIFMGVLASHFKKVPKAAVS